MSRTINYDLLPTHLQEGMRRYIEHHIETGSFLRAVLENDFEQACFRADAGSLHELPHIAFWLRKAPREAWGSPMAVKAWIAAGKRNMTGSLEQDGRMPGAAGEKRKPEAS
jgi:hypothetical protein